jgi:hypothetical protein
MDSTLAGLIELAKIHSFNLDKQGEQIALISEQVTKQGEQISKQGEQIALISEQVTKQGEQIAANKDLVLSTIQSMELSHYDFELQHARIERRYIEMYSDMISLRRDFTILINKLNNNKLL